MNIKDFVKENNIKLYSYRVSKNPNMADDSPMDHWGCKLQIGELGIDFKELKTYYSKGFGHNGVRPTADELLDCLASDSEGIENSRNFEEWCGEYGYDTDSRKAERTYNICKEQTNKLKEFLGKSRYYILLYDIERL